MPPLVKGKKFKEFFHIVENISPAAYEELMAAMKTDPSNMSLLTPMLRPCDALGDQCKLQIFAAGAGDGTFTVIKFFHSEGMIPLRLAKAFCHQKVSVLNYAICDNSDMVKKAFLYILTHIPGEAWLTQSLYSQDASQAPIQGGWRCQVGTVARRAQDLDLLHQ